MRKTKHWLMTIAALLCSFAASAQTEVEIDGIVYNLTPETKQAKVKPKSVNGYSGSINIPAMVTYEGKDYSVTSIGQSAFYGCSSLTDITIPEGVTSIEYRAFYDCSSLTDITIPKSVTSIEERAFVNCRRLTTITIPEGVTEIGDYAFSGCNGLTDITIPKSVTSIGERAFELCSGKLVVNCNIPSGFAYYGGAFYSSSFTNVTIGDGVTNIGRYAF